MDKDVAKLVERLEGRERRVKLGAMGFYSASDFLIDQDAASTIRALDVKLRKAVEVMRDITERGMFSSKDRLVEHLLAFLASMEKQEDSTSE